ncbi:MAG: beta-ketoacyl-ACP synthase II [Bacteroidales bacterium]|nr:beta-ketoacyl-ACP synthase II [Bacteroidales bacterium]
MDLKRVVVTGLGALTPIGLTVETYWDALLKGVSGAGPITRFDAENFRTQFACELKDFDVLNYLPRKEAQRMDPCAQYAIVATLEALQDSGLDLETVDKDRVGVIMGTGVGGFTSMMETANVFVENGRIPRFSPYLLLKVLADMVTGYISLRFGFRGPNYVTTSACASAGNAIGDALHMLQLGKADVIITGGSEAAVVEGAVGGFNSMRALSTRNDDPLHASRPFDTGRDGFVIGEGAGVLVLETLDHALARNAHIYCELCGVGMSADAYNATAPDPHGSGAVMSMRLALQDAQMSPDEIDYVNMHGTSTPLGDLAECFAVREVFGEHVTRMVLNSTKSMIGHLMGAGPAVESIAILMSMRDGMVHPTINLENLDPQIPQDWNFAAHGPVRCEVNAAISNSFGFGGHNVTLLYKKFHQ